MSLLSLHASAVTLEEALVSAYNNNDDLLSKCHANKTMAKAISNFSSNVGS